MTPLMSMVALFACPRCSVHVKAFERRCPHCGAGLPADPSKIGPTATALLLGLSLAACNSKPPPERQRDIQDIYGAPPSDEDDKKGDDKPTSKAGETKDLKTQR